MHILFAEDEPDIREGIAFFLEKRGHTSVTVSNGRELINALVAATGEKKFDAVITDHNMPVMTGLAAVQAIRNMAEFQTLPLIVLSANREIRAGVKAANATFVDKDDVIDGLKTALTEIEGRLPTNGRP